MATKLPIQYAKILYGLTEGRTGKDLDLSVEAFVRYLRGENALSKLAYIEKEFTRYAKMKQGIVEIEIVSARKLDKGEIDTIAKKFGKDVEVTNTVDKDLRGGIIVKKGNQIFDASIQTQIKRLAEHM